MFCIKNFGDNALEMSMWLAGHGSKVENEVWASEEFWLVNTYRGY